MKKVTIQLENADGIIEKENELFVGNNDTLVMQYPESMTLEQAHNCYQVFKDGIENNRVIGLPNTIVIKVIRIQ